MDKYQVMDNQGFLTINVTSKRTITRNPPAAIAPTLPLPPVLQKAPVLPADAEPATNEDLFAKESF